MESGSTSADTSGHAQMSGPDQDTSYLWVVDESYP